MWQRVGLKALGVPLVCRWLASTWVSLEETHPAFLQVPNLESRVWLEFQALALTVRALSGSCNHHNRTCRAAHCLHLGSLKHSTNLMNLRSSPRSTFQQAGLKMRQRACLSPFKETSGHIAQTDHQTECTSKIAKELKADLQFTSLCLPEKQTKHQVSLWMKTKRRQAVSSSLSKFDSHYYAGQKVVGCGFSLRRAQMGRTDTSQSPVIATECIHQKPERTSLQWS